MASVKVDGFTHHNLRIELRKKLEHGAGICWIPTQIQYLGTAQFFQRSLQQSGKAAVELCDRSGIVHYWPIVSAHRDG